MKTINRIEPFSCYDFEWEYDILPPIKYPPWSTILFSLFYFLPAQRRRDGILHTDGTKLLIYKAK